MPTGALVLLAAGIALSRVSAQTTTTTTTETSTATTVTATATTVTATATTVTATATTVTATTTVTTVTATTTTATTSVTTVTATETTTTATETTISATATTSTITTVSATTVTRTMTTVTVSTTTSTTMSMTTSTTTTFTATSITNTSTTTWTSMTATSTTHSGTTTTKTLTTITVPPPTPPIEPGTEQIVIESTVDNINDEDLTEEQRKVITDGCSKEVSAEAGVPKENVVCTTSPGSIKITAVITPPAGSTVTVASILEKLEEPAVANRITVGLLSVVQDTPGIDAIKTGVIDVSSPAVTTQLHGGPTPTPSPTPPGDGTADGAHRFHGASLWLGHALVAALLLWRLGQSA